MSITLEDIAERRADLERQQRDAQATVYAVEGALQDLGYWEQLLAQRTDVSRIDAERAEDEDSLAELAASVRNGDTP